MNVLIHHYGDLDLLRGAVESVPEGLPIHVVDGRFESFGTEELPDLTPGTREFCLTHPDLYYHRPEADRLPFGSEFEDADPTLRPGVHAKARYSYYEVLPGDEWVLQIDTDERVLDLDLSVLDDLDPNKRYQPRFEWDEAGRRGFASPMIVPRVTYPTHWTLWIDDSGVPRREVSRDADLPTVEEAFWKYRDEYYYEYLPEVRLRNLGPGVRDEQYTRDRADHLNTIGRYARATEVGRLARDSPEDDGDRRLNPG